MTSFSFYGKKSRYLHQIGITSFLSVKHDIHQNQRLNQIPSNNMFKYKCANPRIYLGKMREESAIEELFKPMCQHDME